MKTEVDQRLQTLPNQKNKIIPNQQQLAELKRDLSKLQNAITGLPDIGDKVQKRLWW